MDKLAMVEQELLKGVKRDMPEFSQGDIIKIFYKIREKDKVRLHPIEGIVIKVQGAMHRKSFTLRRIAYGDAYEVTMPLYTPNIERIEMVKKSHKPARRARLNYLRERIGKQAMAA